MDEAPAIQGSHVDWANRTDLHPLALAALICLGIAVLVLPRRLAIWPFIIMACFIPAGQRLVLAGLDFSMLRLLTLVGWTRLLTRGENKGLLLQPIDYLMIAWPISGTIIYTLLFQTTSALVFRLGVTFDIIGMYFLFRCLLRDWEDLDRMIVGFGLVSIPVALAFCIEHLTSRNMFAFLGGVPEITLVRGGRLRCQGAFASPILAGCFWASLLPLLAAQWWKDSRARILAVASVLAALLIVVFCASSTPLMAVVFCAVGAAMFPLRRHMRLVRWSLVLLLIGLHMVMRAPVWHLIARIDLTGSSASWYRFQLLNQAIRHIDQWWLLGIKTTGTWDPLLRDVTNQYILEGVRGGLLTLTLFVLIIAMAFAGTGRLQRIATKRYQRMLAWALGVMLFVHCMNFIAIAYFGQIEMLWYLQLAAIASLAPSRTRLKQLTGRRQASRRQPRRTGPVPAFASQRRITHDATAR